MGWSLLSLEITAFTRSLSFEEIKFSLVQSLRDQELLDFLRPKHPPSWTNLNYLLIFFPQLPFSLLLSLTIDEGPEEGLGSGEIFLGTHLGLGLPVSEPCPFWVDTHNTPPGAS